MKCIKGLKKIRGVTKALRMVREELKKKVSVAVIAEPQVEVELISRLQLNALNEVFFATSNILNEVEKRTRIRQADLALVVIWPGESDKELGRKVKIAKYAKEKLVVVTGNRIDDWLVENLAEVFHVSGEDVAFIPISSDGALETTLVPKILSKLKGKEIAVAAAVPLFKDKVASDIISKTAKQNGAIGLAFFIPGSDMPLLTMNQIWMILRLSAVYNQELSAKRLYEILATVGGGFAFRESARQVIGLIPFGGWAVKGAFAYGGTIAMGQLAKKYFESKKGEAFEPLATDRASTAGNRETKSLYKP